MHAAAPINGEALKLRTELCAVPYAPERLLSYAMARLLSRTHARMLSHAVKSYDKSAAPSADACC